jgi:subtilisin family serine protease
MFIPVRTCLLWALGITSVFAGWQGVYASTVFPDRETPDNVTSLRAEATPQALALPRSGPVEDERTPSSAPAAPLLTTVPPAPAPEVKADSGLGWPLERIQAVPLPPAAGAGPPVLVAVLDTGIDGDHKDLAGKVVAGKSFVEDASTGDLYGHGTPIAGIIAADADKDSGFAGMAPASRLINVKVADDDGRCQDTALSEGIIWAADNGASVINISIEMKDDTPRLKEAVDYAWDHGAIIIAAAGNDGGSRPVYPAAYSNCLGVTGVRENGGLAPLANFGDWVDLAAPGYDIFTTLPGDSFGYKYGTSFAAAYVSGLAALLFPRVTDIDGDGHLNDEVLWAIRAGSHATGIDGTGAGLIDVADSLAKAAAISNN